MVYENFYIFLLYFLRWGYKTFSISIALKIFTLLEDKKNIKQFFYFKTVFDEFILIFKKLGVC